MLSFLIQLHVLLDIYTFEEDWHFTITKKESGLLLVSRFEKLRYMTVLHNQCPLHKFPTETGTERFTCVGVRRVKHWLKLNTEALYRQWTCIHCLAYYSCLTDIYAICTKTLYIWMLYMYFLFLRSNRWSQFWIIMIRLTHKGSENIILDL